MDLKLKSQATAEFLIILAVSLLVITVVLQLSQDSMSRYDKMIVKSKTNTLISELSSAGNLVYQQGYRAKTSVYVSVPPHVKNITFGSKTITIEYESGDKQYRTFDFEVLGRIPNEEGNYLLEVEALKGYVVIAENTSTYSGSFSVCGNNIREVGEDCDGTDLGSKSCVDFGYPYGTLVCVECRYDTTFCKYIQSEMCDDGLDNDNDGFADCEDSDCVGLIGPNGGFCCNGDSSNCPGVLSCKSCSQDNECVFNDTTTVCNQQYDCSDAGNNGYNTGGRVPSYGYCDGFGNCDYAASTPLCDYSQGGLFEFSGHTMCVDGNEVCIDTCSDGLDNDEDGCADNIDSDCGGFEFSCNDELDNDCDGFVDCEDSDCNGFIQSGELPNNQFDEIIEWDWEDGANMSGNKLLLHFNEESGQLIDGSGKNNHCIASAAGVSFNAEGIFDTALAFDGTSGYVDCGNDGSMAVHDAITVMAWIYHDSGDSDGGHILNFGGGWTEPGYSLFWYGDDIRVELQNSGEKTISDNTAPSDDAWHLIAFTWDIGSATIMTYFDGELAPVTSSFTGPIGTSSTNLNVGRDEDNDYYFGGIIEEVSVWNRSLSIEEISDIFQRKDYCIYHDCSFICGVENCTNGLDDDGDHKSDCEDPNCIGKTGPKGGTCCAGDAGNCPGEQGCRECDSYDECGFLDSTTVCDADYLCSSAGDNGYNSGLNVPSRGYCDGIGNCDFASDAPLCTLKEGNNSELSGETVCVDGVIECVDTCTDGLDNDADGCIDDVDSGCGNNETNCVNGKDDDCDGLADCNDPDCFLDPSCVGEEHNCTDGIDNDYDSFVDCDDPNCIGQIGPEGSTCCNGNPDNCPGELGCKECAANNECSMYSTTVVCNSAYLCSNSGNNGYNVGGRIPSQGYCDGFGNCDYAADSPLCSISEGSLSEQTSVSICVDSTAACVDTCTDGLDNDIDGCTDSADSGCGATETNCVDGLDNDCDSAVDCADPDCYYELACQDEEADCTDGIDNDNDLAIDCDDADCLGQIGPNGGTCCDGNPANCPGNGVCKDCGVDNECLYLDETTVCNMNYLCSNGGDNGYNTGGRVTSRGYCDGAGNCDYAAAAPICTISESGLSEGTSVTVCVDDSSACVDTCTDGLDNDMDGCTDSADSGCGATETNCVDGLDNDCDGNPDCGDFDCYGETNCMDCGDRSNCAACIADGMCDWCIGGSWGTRCVDSCKTGFFSNCWGGSCYKNSCP